MRRKRYVLQTILFFAVLGITFLIAFGDSPLLGKKPSYVLSRPDPVPNEKAIITRIWAPGLDDGYVPQGVAIAEGAILISTYQSTHPVQDTGPCRVFRIDPKTGGTTGQFDLPTECGHAGGMEYVGNNVIYVVDTRRLFKIDLSRALQDENTNNSLIKSVKLSGDLKGSFLGFDGSDLWIGVYSKTKDAKIYRMPQSVIDKTQEGETIKPEQAGTALPVSPASQGAAFDKQGNLWLTQSSSKFGRLQTIDSKDGKVLAEYNMVIGVEDITFDEEGRLWSVSEAGTRRWLKWKTLFPIIFQMDLEKLK